MNINHTAADPMLEKIRKLLAMAEDVATTEEEAEAFTAKAMTLMAKYGIDRAMVPDTDPRHDTIVDRAFLVPRPFGHDRVTLLNVLAMEMRCKLIYTPTKGLDNNHKVRLIGYSADLDRMDALFTSLLLQMNRFMARLEIPPWENGKVYKRDWMQGFTSAVHTRLRDIEQRARREAEQASKSDGTMSVELVLVDRKQLVDQRVAELFPSLTGGRSRSARQGAGVRVGFQDGRSADLGGTKVGGSSTGRRSIG